MGHRQQIIMIRYSGTCPLPSFANTRICRHTWSLSTIRPHAPDSCQVNGWEAVCRVYPRKLAATLARRIRYGFRIADTHQIVGGQSRVE